MARQRERDGGRGRRRSRLQELEETSASPSAAGESRLVEFDPEAAQARAQAVGIQEAEATADTFDIEEGWFAAQKALEERFGGEEGIAAFSVREDAEPGGSHMLGTAIGFRMTNGRLTSEIAVKVFVDKKVPESELSPQALVPSEINGYPTDVEAIEGVMPYAYTGRYRRPVPCGVSCGHPLIGAGTIGCLVQIGNGKLCLLSNNHVIAAENRGRGGNRIIQPGRADGGRDSDEDRIAILENFVPLRTSGNVVDAAVAWTNFPHVAPNHVTYTLNPTPVRARLGLSVTKCGRTTENTLGMITDVSLNIPMPYIFFGNAHFSGQIGIRGTGGTPFSKQGDSGSLVVTASTKQPVALIFGGTTDFSASFANPIEQVMAALDIVRFIAEVE